LEAKSVKPVVLHSLVTLEGKTLKETTGTFPSIKNTLKAETKMQGDENVLRSVVLE
jgi:hypothetical protein